MERYMGPAYNRSEDRIRNNKIRRNRELRRRLLIFAVSLILFVSLVFIFFSSKSVASNEAEEILYKYYVTVTVEPGDTLYDLSLEYVNPEFNNSRSFIDEVKFINNINDEDSLIAGEMIFVPCYDTYEG